MKSIGSSVLKITAFRGEEGKDQCCKVVHLGVVSKDGRVQKLSLLTVPIICEPLSGASISNSVVQCDHIDGLEIADSISGEDLIEIDVLVGLDQYWNFIMGKVIRGGRGPIALYSSLGWILSGPVTSTSTTLVTHVLTVSSCKAESKVNLDQQLKRFWDLESLGIVQEKDELYDQFKLNVTFTGERYEVALPWKDSALWLPDNYQLSLRRLQGLLRRLRQQPELLMEYDKAIREQLSSGIVERVLDPAVVSGERVHYLPHHAVIRRDKETTKLRVVYDGSARGEGVSLNDCLYVGPKFNQHLFDILLRFRLSKCGFVADIEKAFLMISVGNQDRDVLRFLWVSDINEHPPTIEVLRFARITFGIACSPFLLNATIKHHLETCTGNSAEVVAKIARSLYVDDVVGGARSEAEALKKYHEYRQLLSSGGFNLRKFLCNSESIPQLGEQKVLGVKWDLSGDELVVDLREAVHDVQETEVLTKRRIVSIVSRIFDPIGIASPVTIQAKLLLQQLHKAKMEWDSSIEGELLMRCWNILHLLRESQPIHVPRWYERDWEECDNASLRLCGFSDASTKAYAAVVYLV